MTSIQTRSSADERVSRCCEYGTLPLRESPAAGLTPPLRKLLYLVPCERRGAADILALCDSVWLLPSPVPSEESLALARGETLFVRVGTALLLPCSEVSADDARRKAARGEVLLEPNRFGDTKGCDAEG